MEQPPTFKEKAKGLLSSIKKGEKVKDTETGKVYELESETLWDIFTATFSILYLLAVLVILCWALFDIYHGQNQLLTRIFPEETNYPDSPLSRLIAYAIIGGGLGGVVNGCRSIISWHAERRAFGWRFMWKYITLPPLGAVLAPIVYAIVYCGIGVLGGGYAQDNSSTSQALSAFAIGALSGYGSRQVYIWLDEQVKKLFNPPPPPQTETNASDVEVKVPDLKKKTQKEAEAVLKEFHLKLGKVTKEVSDKASAINKVINQNPPADSKIAKDNPVDITIAVKE
ncbi:MAG: PASTA domain-containing protein [Planctomycetota bacterium]|jgi:hypothetical protein